MVMPYCKESFRAMLGSFRFSPNQFETHIALLQIILSKIMENGVNETMQNCEKT